ncbi:Kinesin-like protein KIF13B [Phytophthora citrophthora]|uniref:Kinesin-like protein KIF13B n=1 Tax=Phytophthora citrophthora TaxID=4793 RepID=A0AAD9H031_9STRA|nr:Kinesin-like protein KIF13B [Phytophthora citrophthora]
MYRITTVTIRKPNTSTLDSYLSFILSHSKPPYNSELPTAMKRPSFRPSQSTDEDAPCAIKVVVRARPLNDKEKQGKTPVVINVSRSGVQVVNPVLFSDPAFLDTVGSDVQVTLSPAAINAATLVGECRTFHFDRCFGASVGASGDVVDVDEETQRPNQELIFDDIGQSVIESAFQGFNCTLFAYGQTGSGKTHTMVGEKSISGKGVIPRVCEALFREIDVRRDKEASVGEEDESDVKRTIYGAHVSYCEIYKEKVNDLLDTEGNAAMEKRRPSFSTQTLNVDGETSIPRKTLKVREHPVTGPFVEGLSIRSVTSYADIAEEMLAGEKLRTVASTLMNPVSSRSHAVFTITVTQTTFDPVSQCANDKTSKISMIDLAGSERANVSGTSGDRLKEGAMINKSLTTLGRVISALSKQGADRIPYRDSTLTWLLKESLGGNAKTTMFAMISPSSDNYEETMSTLRYAESAKKVMNRAVVNEDKNARIIRQLRKEIEELRAQLAAKGSDSPAKERVNAGISASLVERESFYADLQKEVDFFRSQQQSLTENRAARAIHLSDSLPSLVNLSANLVPGEALAYVLVEGTTLFGSDPNPDMTKYETVEVQNDVEKAPESVDKLPKKKRHGSWTSTILRRRKSSSKSAPSTPSVNISSKLDASEVALALSADKRSVIQICKLPGDEVSRILPRHARFICSRVPKGPNEEEADEFVVELESLDPSAILLVNGQPLEYGSEHPLKLHHGDQVRLGKPYCFRIHVPGFATTTPRIAEAVEQPPELDIDKDEGRELEALVEEANAICTKWLLNTEFAVGTEETSGTVVVKKKLEAHCFSTVHWDRTMLELKLQFLREFAASLETVASFTVEETPKIEDFQIPEPSPKVTTSRRPSRLSDNEQNPEQKLEQKPEQKPEQVEEAIDTEKAKISEVKQKLHSHTVSSLRLLGYGRAYLGAQPSGSLVPLPIAIYDFSGTFVGNLETRLEGISEVALPAKKRGILSPKAATSSLHRIRVHLDQMKIDTGSFVSASGISITLKETTSKVHLEVNTDGKEPVSEESSSAKIFSTPRVPPTDQKTFVINESFETSVTATQKQLFSHSTAEEESLLVEVWGYNVKLARYTILPANNEELPADLDTQQVEFYVSVDVEEREVDGLYHPVAVKPDGALRLHANRSRRLIVRVTQSDQQPFALSEIVHVRIAAPDAPSVNRTASMSRMMGKTTQRMLPSSRTLYEQHDRSPSGESQSLDVGSTRWQVLEFRGDCGVDEISRSLNAILRWDHAPDSDLEPINTAGSRSTYRLAIAFKSQWSKMPIVISKSLVAKVCGSSVSAAQRFTRGLAASRTVWWAKESFSRSYRLGTWYAADILVDDTPLDDENPAKSQEEEDSINDAVIAKHISGLHRLDIVMQLERVRQKVSIMMSLRLTEPPTAPKVNLCLDELFKRTDDEVQVFECVEVHSELFLRHLRRTDLLMNLASGKVEDFVQDEKLESTQSIELKLHGHVIHFVSEPTQRVGGDQLEGEMSGFLMLSLSSALDEETAAAVVAPLASSARPKSPPKAGGHRVGWERQWFVLKRPFLYVYQTFARKQQTGVMDLSLCQLIVATSSDVPFSFRLVCVDGRKQSAVWWLQASTASEMRAWLVAIDPLKIEARQSVAATPIAGTPTLTA